ncbi:MAG: hypothetical protein F8N36_14270 [Desulfovibrio sp.]|uniref:DEAD/DEAH box helicase n=1 Tax=Desulfovibrio sp. TaxID=885 RepID=UPI00135E3F30|nr:AAA domain-containing protein [Desulfovibrio sp.]MTJ94004.1 hypothetical protein [Desulfovibrio sp.]
MVERCDPSTILRYWQGIEYLSTGEPPKNSKSQPFNVWEPKTGNDLPWSPSQSRRFQETGEGCWRFFLWIGIVSTDSVVDQLIRFFDFQDEVEPFAAKPTAMMCLTASAEGEIFGEPGFSTSPWAMGTLQQTGRMPAGGWSGETGAEQAAQDDFHGFLATREIYYLTENGDGDLVRTQGTRPFSIEDAVACAESYAAGVRWTMPPDGKFVPLRIEARWVKKDKNGRPYAVEPGLLNSFLMDDLTRILAAFANGENTGNVEQYLFGIDEAKRIDVTRKREVLHEILRPAKMPFGKWPTDGHHHLVLAQQMAVNLAFEEIGEDGGLFGTNGPPGTGKTTLLRDMVAAVIVDRALVLSTFADPDAAFARRIGIRDHEYGGWEISEKLLGFEMVVASANNGAVENVTTEIPAAKAIDSSWRPVAGYFPSVADTVFSDNGKTRSHGKCWGMLAAVLGNSENKKDFVNSFWFGTPKKDEPITDETRISMQWYLRNATPPNWNTARKSFLASVEAVKVRLAKLDALAVAHQRVIEVDALEMALNEALAILDVAEADKAKAATALEAIIQIINADNAVADTLGSIATLADHVAALEPEITAELKKLGARNVEYDKWRGVHLAEEAALAILTEHAPKGIAGIIDRFFNGKWSRSHSAAVLKVADCAKQKILAEHQRQETEAGLAELNEAQKKSQTELAEAGERLSQAKAALQQLLADAGIIDEANFAELKDAAEEAVRVAKENAASLQRKAEEIRAKVKIARQKSVDALEVVAGSSFSGAVIDAAFLTGPEDIRQLSSPWMDDELHRLRCECFIQAIQLHRAFIMCSPRLRSNLSLAVDILSGKLRPAQFGGYLRDIWASFFLTVPVVSSTFASFSRLFDGLECGEIGWVFVDEGGQATPQQALGAVWRAERAMIIGDPKQIKPVVPLPGQAIELLRRREGVGPHWHPILHSAQVLADRATRYGAQMGVDSDNPYWVGSPLRVHRRCRAPMFEIANAVAYDGLMVQGKVYRADDIAKFPAGPSRWIDVPASTSEGHYIPAQGNVAQELVRTITGAPGAASVYVVTPFAESRAKLFSLFNSSRGLGFDWAVKSVGTVHTFQGKEADYVIFVLGGEPNRPRARQWAAQEPNLLNVAVTRARKAVYVVGDWEQWSSFPYFDEMARMLPRVSLSGAPHQKKPNLALV